MNAWVPESWCAPAEQHGTETHGRVYWITGLSGAGKTTVGLELWQRLRSIGRPAVFLDGDTLRQTIADELGHSGTHRRRSAMRNARLCQLLSKQGHDVVCTTISLFHSVQRWNREHIPGYREIYLRVPLQELQKRDRKGIYAAAQRGELTNVVGLDLPAELPETPDLIIDNHGELDPIAAVNRIWSHCIDGTSPPTSTPDGVAVAFGTKAETLEQLRPLLRGAVVLPQVRCSVAQWRADRRQVLSAIAAAPWSERPLIVRSSAQCEDAVGASQAGRYCSIAGVCGAAAIEDAVKQVIASFGADHGESDQVFVQPLLERVAMSGVAFSRAPSGAPYYVINYDQRSGNTDGVTSGNAAEVETFYCVKSHWQHSPAPLAPVLALLRELEELLRCDAIDVEFAIDTEGQLHLLQVRRLTVHSPATVGDAKVDEALNDLARKIELLSRAHPYLHGSRGLFGVMPDWNPAEMIGLRPRPLSLSLYRELITDAIWAYQRDNYGYKNLRSFPLLVSFHGLPYIDVRVSFNSFVPRTLSDGLAERLVNYYLDSLRAHPQLHDKVEFEIIFSCYTLDLPQRLSRLTQHGFSQSDIDELAGGLRTLTNGIIHGESALWRRDREKIDRLAERLPKIYHAGIDKISRIYWLLEDCKRYGTLPFAGLARAGFVAVQLLKSFVNVGILNTADYTQFMASVDTVGSRIGSDFEQLSKTEFLARYGHLRPGTYDLLSPRYDEAPDLYFDWSAARPIAQPRPRFALSIEQLRDIERRLRQHQINSDPLSLMEFIKGGIEGREYAKFIFTRSLSDALSLIRQVGEEHGLSAEDCSYIDYETIRRLQSESGSVREALEDSIARGKRHYALTSKLVLPPLIASPEDVFAFHLPPTAPNFVTDKSVTAAVASIDEPPEHFAGRILFVPSADPGFDWIFTRDIAGFVTQFGGANSHMAIRANELGIPAVIGAGEALFERWRVAQTLCIDCLNGRVTAIA